MSERDMPLSGVGREEFLMEWFRSTARNSRAVVASAREARTRAEVLLVECEAARARRAIDAHHRRA